MVIITHLVVYCWDVEGDAGIPYWIIAGVIDQIAVVPFFLFSGFGLAKGFMKEGRAYTKHIVLKHLLKLMLYTTIFLIPYFVRDYVMNNGFNKPFADYLLVLVGIKQLGNQYWFIFAIYYCYLATIIAGLFKFKNENYRALLVLVFTAIYFAVSVILKKETHFYDTILAFPIGMFIAVNKNKINAYLNNKKRADITMIVSGIIYVLLTALYLVLGDKHLWIIREPKLILFTVFAICYSKRFTLKSKMFYFLGNYTWPVFMLHMLPIRLFKDFNLTAPPYLLACFVSCLAISALGVLLQMLLDKLFVSKKQAPEAHN